MRYAARKGRVIRMYVLGKNICTLRTNCGLKQEELAKRIGVSKATISNYENGVTKPAFSKLPRIADALGVEVSDLFDGTVQKMNFDDIHSPNFSLTLHGTEGNLVYDERTRTYTRSDSLENTSKMFEDFDNTSVITSYQEPMVLKGDIPRADIYEDENGDTVIYTNSKVMLFKDFEGGRVIANVEDQECLVDTRSDKGTQLMCGSCRIGEIIYG